VNQSPYPNQNRFILLSFFYFFCKTLGFINIRASSISDGALFQGRRRNERWEIILGSQKQMLA
jgi:hypothetical protein